MFPPSPAAADFFLQEASMSLLAKYANAVSVAQSFGAKAAEEAGKLSVKGTVQYQLEKDAIWDAIKKQDGWEGEVAADIRNEKTDIYGIYEVKAGDSLSKIAKSVYDDVGKYMQIFQANTDILKDPNVIHPGQKLVIPNK
jgi:nucleoid-associated protein YgaU